MTRGYSIFTGFSTYQLRNIFRDSLKSSENLIQLLFVILAFVFPLSVALGNTLIYLIILIWIFSGNLKSKLQQIFQNNLAILSIVFFGINLLGMLWTTNIEMGLFQLKKMIDFLLILPIFLVITRKENIPIYINLFLFSIGITIFLSFLVWFEIIPPILKATLENPTVTMSHISYNPFLAIAAYICLYLAYIKEGQSSFLKIFLTVFFVAITINMFITGGRAGQIMFIFMFVFFFFQKHGYRGIKSYLLIFFFIPGIVFLAYEYSDNFNRRINDSIKNAHFIEDEGLRGTSIGQRFTWAESTIDMFLKYPLYGVGTGDFKDEFEKIHNKKFGKIVDIVPITNNPHNMYLLVLSTLGILGFISFMLIFAYQISFAIKSKGFSYYFGITLPLSFLLIMLSDAYLLGHFTTTLYVFFSSFLYKNFDTD